jgi:hypothetical protein
MIERRCRWSDPLARIRAMPTLFLFHS